MTVSPDVDVPERVPFLQERYVTDTCKRIRIPAPQREALVRALRFFEDEPVWKRTAWQQHLLLFGDGRLPPDPVPCLPIPDDSGEAAALYLALLFLSGVPNVFAYHASRGIPENVTADTLNDMNTRLEAFRSDRGYYGMRTHRWTIHPFAGKFYTLGRLQFMMGTFGYGFRAFRHRKTGWVMLLAESGIRFRSDGQHATAIGAGEPQGVWTSELIEDGRTIRGTRITPRGMAVRDPVTLEKPAWECILRKGDPVLNMHIPPTGPMDFDACGESIHRAVTFFREHFPEYRFAAFTCSSWFLDSQLEQYLPATSNIVRFMAEVYLHSVPRANDEAFWKRVFGGPVDDLDSAPQDTSLRRAVIAHARRGGFWRNGALVMFPQDLEWGAGVYRRGERAWLDSTSRGQLPL